MLKTIQSIANFVYKLLDRINHQISLLIPNYHQFVLTRGKAFIRFLTISSITIAVMNVIFLYSLWWLVGVMQFTIVLFYRLLVTNHTAIPESTNKLIFSTAFPLLSISIVNTIALNLVWLVLVLTNFSQLSMTMSDSQTTYSMMKSKKSIIFFLLIISSVLISNTVPYAIVQAIHEPKVRFVNEVEPVDSYQLYASGPANNEHVMPKEWFVDTERVSQMNFYNDYVNVVKANEIVNNLRGHLPFCMVDMNAVNDIKSSNAILGYRQIDECFMPLDEYKGDAARIILYMYLKYEPYIKPEYRSSIDIKLMKQWSHQDPVSNKEKQHNDKIRAVHHYDNPFVSYPVLVNYIG